MKNKISYIVIIIFIFNVNASVVVDFDRAMNSNSREYKNKYYSVNRKKSLSCLKRLYLKNSPTTVTVEAIPKIPKIIHQIWVGSKPMPDFLQSCIKSWKKLHPDWEYNFWTDIEVKNLNLYNQDLYDNATDPREKADILRYELLYRYGGLYVDCDFECLETFDALHYCYDLYVGISPNNVEEIITNALIGCVPNHPFMLKVVENQKTIQAEKWQFRSGVYYFSNQCIKYLENAPGINIAFPTSFFYPLPFKFNKNKSLQSYIKPETMALHYWAKSQGTNWKPLKKGT